MDRNLVISSIFIFLIGVLLLLYYFLVQKPLPLSSLKSYDGEYVVTQGTIIRTSITKSGNKKYLISDGSGKAYVVTSENISCRKILVKGKVDVYFGKIYIFVPKKTYISCLS